MSLYSAQTFTVTPTPAGTELRLLDRDVAVSTADWAFCRQPGVALAQRLVAEDVAIDGDNHLLISHDAIARLEAREAAMLNLPPLTGLMAVVDGSGIMMRPDFSVAIRWTRPGGQNVLGVRRIGAWLIEADGARRLPETLFSVVEAVQAHGAAAGDEALRLQALARLREVLPPAATTGAATGDGLLGTVTLVEAGSFSLAAHGQGDDLQLEPILHRDGSDPAPLLSSSAQRALGRDQFLRFPTARAVYTLPGGTYVILSPALRRAMEVVRRSCAGSPAQRRALLQSPRAAIRAAMGDDADELVLESLVVETPSWSERVIGLGLWKKRVLPWVERPTNDWFAEPGLEGRAPSDRSPAVQGGLIVGDRRVTLTPDVARDVAVAVQSAMARNEPHVEIDLPDGPLAVPADQETLAALAALAAKRPAESPPLAPAAETAGRGEPVTTMMIETNELDLGVEFMVRPRTAPAVAGEPEGLRSTLKHHQREGLTWLQQSWSLGTPGVLLADDMGLGKTLQGLAFLCWLRQAMVVGELARAPVLIVAPTGLLENWRKEHDLHLRAPGLGEPLLAYGRGLAALRRGAAGDAALDRAALGAADWVLTTYETLRDHLTDFGQVRFAAMLLDEAQKAKTPGIRLTDAVKAMNTDFRVALTGTPVENRLADLWCILDCAWAGLLRDLRWFSARYERAIDAERLHELKAMLDQPSRSHPPVMLRRLREDWLPDLPPRREMLLRGEMTGTQREAYEAAVALGKRDGDTHVLTALQRLREASLHGGVDDDDDDQTIAAKSIRLRLALTVLDEVAQAGERALVFVGDIAFMARLSGLLQRRYRLAQPPMMISGQVAGPARQARVDLFQTAPAGFDVMLLSPGAGGVGLTLTRANHVIHLTRWWNPAVEDQCSGRAHRIGQERPVSIHVPLATLPDSRKSFDEHLHALLERKRALTRNALLPPVADSGELAEMLRETLG